MTSEENLKHQGTLEKQCKLKTWSWKKYWFVLFNEQLCYYKEQDSAKSSGGRRLSSTELGEIDLGLAHSIREMKNLNHGFPFEIATKARTFILSADKEETRAQWVKLLLQARELGVSKRRTNSIRSIKSSCNSIDEADDGYSDIQTASMNRLSASSRNAPAPPPPGINRSQSAPDPPTVNRNSTAIKGSITEETEDDLYTDIQTTDIVNKGDDVAVDDSSDDPYSYAVKMRKKTWKFMSQNAVDGNDEDDSYAQVGYDTTYESAEVNNYDSSAQAKTASHTEKKETTSKGVGSEIPEYASVIPKAKRLAKAVSAAEKSNPDKSKDDDYVYIRDVNSNENKHTKVYATKSMIDFPTIPSLAHPRVEYTDRSHFDDIRLFLCRNRGMDEVYRDPPAMDLGGNSINKLTDFLSALDPSVESEIESTHL